MQPRRVPACLALAAAVAGTTVGAAAATPPTAVATRLDTVTGITDLVGVRTDGLLIARTTGGLRLVDAQGGTYPFAAQNLARLPGASEPVRMLALAPLLPGDPLCPFRPNDLPVFSPRSGSDQALFMVDAQGVTAPWSSIPDGTPVAASFDQSGRFGQTLLVAVDRGGDGAVEELDCRGGRADIAHGISGLQPGIAVLAAGAGGDAVVATRTGLLTVTPSGAVAPLLVDGWSTTVGGRVAGLATVPSGFVAGGGAVDFADTRGLLHAGAADLGRAGLRDGDLLVTAGAPARLVGVHCEGGSCAARVLARGDGIGEATTRPVVVAAHVSRDVLLPRDAEGAGWGTLAAVGGGLGVLALPAVLRLRRRRSARLELEERLLDE